MTLTRYRVCYVDGFARYVMARTEAHARQLAYQAHYAGIDSLTPAPLTTSTIGS